MFWASVEYLGTWFYIQKDMREWDVIVINMAIH
jgi:hypothetical protein